MILIEKAPVTVEQFAEATGWTIKDSGACQGDVCVPTPGGLRSDGTVDVGAVADRLGMPIVTDDEHRVSAVGPATLGGRALTTAVAADPVLIDRDGADFRLSNLRGRKVVLVAWSSY